MTSPAYEPELASPGAGMPGAPGTPPRRTGWATWSPFAKVLVVLAVTCAALFGVMLLATIAGGVWLFMPGSQVESTRAIPAGSTMIARVHADVDDPGVAQLLALVGRQVQVAQQAQQARDLPEELRFLARMQSANMTDALASMWPRDVTVAVDETGAFTAVVNMRRLGGAVRAGFKALSSAMAEQQPPVEHRGHTLIDMDGFAVTLEGSSILAAAKIEPLQRLVDRVEDEVATPADSLLWPLSQRLQAEGDGHVVMRGAPFLAAHGLGQSAASHAGVVVDLVSEDEVRGRVLVQPAEGQAAAVEAALTAFLAGLERDARADGLTVAVQRSVAPSGEQVAVIEMRGVATALSRAILEGLTAPARETPADDAPSDAPPDDAPSDAPPDDASPDDAPPDDAPPDDAPSEGKAP